MRDGSGVALIRWDAAKRAIAEAHSVDELRLIRDRAEAYRYALKVAGEAPDVVRKAEEIKLRAERRAGELLREMPKARGGFDGREPDGSLRLHAETAETYADLGIDKVQAHRWQKIAEIPEEKFEEFVATAPEVTTSGALRLLKELQAEEVAAARRAAPLPAGKYRVIYADPPWLYSREQHSTEEQQTVLATHYPSMPTEEICQLPVSDMAIDDAVLFLWATAPLIRDALAVIDAWDFDYKAQFVWDKVRHNVGHYNSVRHELLLIATRGSCLPDSRELHDSVVSIERTEHSAKPPYFRQLIDRMYLPRGRDRIELFARGQLPSHWERWGNE